ncbi:MAG: hypothetical protein NVSMB44_06100 [Ktedonobacteraceae bacterium]
MVDRLVSNGLIGVLIGNYRVERLVEEGKWGPVFQVYAKNGMRYLLRFSEHLAVDGADEHLAAARLVFLGHFQHEASLIAMLQHPHILPLLDYGNFHGWPYLVYPHLSLSSLDDILRGQSGQIGQCPLPLATVSEYLYQITSALEYAHGRGILHRNLSTACIYIQPETLLSQSVQSDMQFNASYIPPMLPTSSASPHTSTLASERQASGRVIVAEFGLRRIIELGRSDLRAGIDADGVQPRPTYDGSIEASAPEQLLGQPVDAYTDIYACGVILYRMLTGHAPFEGETRAEVARQHLYVQVPPLHMWRKDVPGALNGVLKKALEKDPTQRYRRPSELARAYQRAIALPLVPEPTPTDVVASRLSIGERPQTGRAQSIVSRRRLFVLAGAAGAVVVASVLAGTHMLQGQPASTSRTVPSVPQPASVQPQPTQGAQSAVQPAAPGQKVLVHTTDIPVNGTKAFAIANQQQPGLLVRLTATNFVAFDSTCPHAGCAVGYNEQTRLLECPCHGATFDPARKAAVVSGPAQSPLAAINIQVHPDGTITRK